MNNLQVNPIQISAELFLISFAFFVIYQAWGKKFIESRIQHNFDEKLESFKSKLQTESQIEIATHTSTLAATTKQKEIQFTKLREQQAPIFKKFYENLSETYDAIGSLALMKPSPTVPVDYFHSREIYSNFYSFYLSNKIFFNNSLCTKIDRLNLTILAVQASFYEACAKIQDEKESSTAAKRAWDFYHGECTDKKNEIEKELREVMGV